MSHEHVDGSPPPKIFVIEVSWYYRYYSSTCSCTLVRCEKLERTYVGGAYCTDMNTYLCCTSTFRTTRTYSQVYSVRTVVLLVLKRNVVVLEKPREINLKGIKSPAGHLAGGVSLDLCRPSDTLLCVE